MILVLIFSTLYHFFSVQVRVGGQFIDPATFKKNIAYCMQDDALMATSTPREALAFSAMMRLPSNISEQDIALKVAQVGNDYNAVHFAG